MTYTTLEQLTQRFGAERLRQLTDRATPPAGAIDTDVVNRALEDTDAEIDGYLAVRYKLPIADTPTLLRDLALSIAIYKLHVRDAAEKIVKDYDAAIRTLRLIAKGEVKLNLEGVEPAGSGSSGVRTTDRERPMTEANLKAFI